MLYKIHSEKSILLINEKKYISTRRNKKINKQTFPLQVLVTLSHGNPVSMHRGPIMFGEESPSFAWENIATKGPLTKVN